jgi:hypothetical protein
MKNSIIWIGPIVNNKDTKLYPAHSAAANAWQLGFISGIKENNYNILVLSYIPFSSWPKGPFWVNGYSEEVEITGLKQIFTGYINIKLLRELWIGASLFILTLIKYNNFIKYSKFIITYNPLLSHRLATMLFRGINSKLKWVSILADNFVKGKPYLTLFLSIHYFKKYPHSNKYFLDGGIVQNTCSFSEPALAPKVILYAGSQTKITGLKDFVNLFIRINSNEFELHVYGRATDAELKEICTNSKRVKQFGFVDDDKLSQACSKAYAFVNPRPGSKVADTTFPSKLLYYLQFEKPIISSATKTIDDKYKELLLLYKPNDIHSLNTCLEKLKSIDLTVHSQIVRDFKSKNSWPTLVKHFLLHVSS